MPFNFDYTSADEFSSSDELAPDWPKLSVNRPKKIESKSIGDRKGFVYLNFVSDKEKFTNAGLTENVLDTFQKAFSYLYNFYFYELNTNPRKLASRYYDSLPDGKKSEFYSFDYRKCATLKVFLKIPIAYLENFGKREIPNRNELRPTPISTVYEDLEWIDFIANYFNQSDLELRNGSVDVVDKNGFRLDLRREARFLLDYRKKIQNYFQYNDINLDSSPVQLGFSEPDDKRILYVSDKESGNIHEIGHEYINKLIPTKSELQFAVVSDYQGARRKILNGMVEEDSSGNKRSATALSVVLSAVNGEVAEKSLDQLGAYGNRVVERTSLRHIGPLSQQLQNPYSEQGGGGVFQAGGDPPFVRVNNEFATRVSDLCRSVSSGEMLNNIYKTSKDVAKEEAKAEASENLQRLDKFVRQQVGQGGVFVGNEIFSLEALTSGELPPATLERIYEDWFSKAGLRRLGGMALHCLIGPNLLELIEQLIECIKGFKPPKIPFPDDIGVPGLLEKLGKLLLGLLLRLISNILNQLLAMLLRHLRDCLQQAVKGSTSPQATEIIPNNGQKICGFSRDKFSNFLEDLTACLSFKELCDLLRGRADDKTLEIVQKIMKAKYPQMAEELDTLAKIEKCLSEFGNGAVDKINEICRKNFGTDVNKLDEFLCPETGLRDRVREQILSDKNLDQQEIDEILEGERQRTKKNMSFLRDLVEGNKEMKDIVYGEDKTAKEALSEITPNSSDIEEVRTELKNRFKENADAAFGIFVRDMESYFDVSGDGPILSNALKGDIKNKDVHNSSAEISLVPNFTTKKTPIYINKDKRLNRKLINFEDNGFLIGGTDIKNRNYQFIRIEYGSDQFNFGKDSSSSGSSNRLMSLTDPPPSSKLSSLISSATLSKDEKPSSLDVEVLLEVMFRGVIHSRKVDEVDKVKNVLGLFEDKNLIKKRLFKDNVSKLTEIYSNNEKQRGGGQKAFYKTLKAQFIKLWATSFLLKMRVLTRHFDSSEMYRLYSYDIHKKLALNYLLGKDVGSLRNDFRIVGGGGIKEFEKINDVSSDSVEKKFGNIEIGDKKVEEILSKTSNYESSKEKRMREVFFENREVFFENRNFDTREGVIIEGNNERLAVQDSEMGNDWNEFFSIIDDHFPVGREEILNSEKYSIKPFSRIEYKINNSRYSENESSPSPIITDENSFTQSSDDVLFAGEGGFVPVNINFGENVIGRNGELSSFSEIDFTELAIKGREKFAQEMAKYLKHIGTTIRFDSLIHLNDGVFNDGGGSQEPDILNNYFDKILTILNSDIENKLSGS